MTVIVCIEDRGGTLFMNRRLSKDRLLTEDIIKTVGDGLLYICEYSKELFEGSRVAIISSADLLKKAGEHDFVFVEGAALAETKDKIDRLIIYKWNRKYPFDKRLDVTPEECGLTLTRVEDFKGYSHEKITKEVYEK